MGRPIVLAERGWLFRTLGEKTAFWGALGGVILGQAVVFGGLRPFALSYLAAAMLDVYKRQRCRQRKKLSC